MKTSLALTLILLTSLSGCASRGAKEKGPIPRTGPTVAELYRGQTAAAIPVVHGRDIYHGDADLRGYTRESHTELRQLFPRVSNPVLVTYVFPHITQSGLPVPGYTTAFRMYADDAFALPGEQPLFVPPGEAPAATDSSNR